MVDASELRIGNLVFINNESLPPFPQYIMALHCDECWVKKVGAVSVWSENYDNIDPIPITPEWLERLGFERAGSILDVWNIHLIVVSGQLYWSKKNGVRHNDFYSDCGISLDFDHIKYIHQLQNLYFALTGKELELKPI